MKLTRWLVIWAVCATAAFAAMLLAGCESKVVTNGEWSARFDRVLVDNSFDKATIIVEPNGTAHITLERYKSDGTKAIELAETVLKVSAGAAAVGAGL